MLQNIVLCSVDKGKAKTDHRNISLGDNLKYVNARHLQGDLLMLATGRQNGTISKIATGMLRKYPYKTYLTYETS